MEKRKLNRELLDGAKIIEIDFAVCEIDDPCNFNRLFERNSTIQKVTLKGELDKRIIDLSHLFSHCSALKEVDMSAMTIAGAVEDMSYMFNECRVLERVIFPKFGEVDTANLGDVSAMFRECVSIKEIDLSEIYWRYPLEDMDMFFNCQQLERLNISGIKELSDGVFIGCNSLKEIIMHRCDREAIGEILRNIYLYNRYFPEKITVDEDVEKIIYHNYGELCLKSGKDAEYFCHEPLDCGENIALATYADFIYFDLDVEPGKIMWLLVHYPVYCKIGDTFAITIEEKTGKHVILKLLSIMYQKNEWGIVLIEVQKVGTFRDFIIGAKENDDVMSQIRNEVDDLLAISLPAGDYFYTGKDRIPQKIANYIYPTGEGYVYYSNVYADGVPD